VIGLDSENEMLVGQMMDWTCSEAELFWSDDDVEVAAVPVVPPALRQGQDLAENEHSKRHCGARANRPASDSGQLGSVTADVAGVDWEVWCVSAGWGELRLAQVLGRRGRW
jgi:hypothetical protein